MMHQASIPRFEISLLRNAVILFNIALEFPVRLVNLIDLRIYIDFTDARWKLSAMLPVSTTG